MKGPMTPVWLRAVLLSVSVLAITEVFIVPHSHTDAGWVYTFDEYYNDQVQHILTSVVNDLVAQPDHVFVWADIAFFARWYDSRNNATQEHVQRLVREGRLDFVGGGWVMNDEAVAHYPAIIDQMTLGHEYLKKHFGVRPRIGWQIDPFGGSSTMSNLFAMMGYDTVVHARINELMKQRLMGSYDRMAESGGLQFVWRASPLELGGSADVFTHVLAHGYQSPYQAGGWNWEGNFQQHYAGGNPPIWNNENQLRSDAERSYTFLREYANFYKTDLILMPFGDDFRFAVAEEQFRNMDALIAYINRTKTDMVLHYGTLTQYFDALHRKQHAFPMFSGEALMPYCDQYYQSYELRWWTGFYANHGVLKRTARAHEAKMRAADMLFVFAKLTGNLNAAQTSEVEAHLLEGRKVSGILQHHDAISSTSPLDTIMDYMSMLELGMQHADLAMSASVVALIAQHADGQQSLEVITDQTHTLDPGWNDQEGIPVVLFNSLAWPVTQVVKLNVAHGRVHVKDSHGHCLPCDVFAPTFAQASFPGSEHLPSMYELYFEVSLDALALATVYVLASPGVRVIAPQLVHANATGDDPVRLQNEHVSLAMRLPMRGVDAVWNMTHLASGRWTNVAPQYMKYTAHAGSDVEGAYTFRPGGPARLLLDTLEEVYTYVAKGDVVQQVFQIYAASHAQIAHTVRLHKNQDFVEVDTEIGPLDANDAQDVVLRYQTNLHTDRDYFVDSNGQGLIHRQLRQDADLQATLTQGHYAPAASAVAIQDRSASQFNGLRFSVVLDRALGATSVVNGSIELMIARITNRDDGLGMDEELKDPDRVRLVHRLRLDALQAFNFSSADPSQDADVESATPPPPTPVNGNTTDHRAEGADVLHVGSYSSLSIRHHALALNYPFVILAALNRSMAQSEDVVDNHNVNVEQWSSTVVPCVKPADSLHTQFMHAHGLHLLSLQAIAGYPAEEVHVRIRLENVQSVLPGPRTRQRVRINSFAPKPRANMEVDDVDDDESDADDARLAALLHTRMNLTHLLGEHYRLTRLQELTLNANQPLSDWSASCREWLVSDGLIDGMGHFTHRLTVTDGRTRHPTALANDEGTSNTTTPAPAPAPTPALPSATQRCGLISPDVSDSQPVLAFKPLQIRTVHALLTREHSDTCALLPMRLPARIVPPPPISSSSASVENKDVSASSSSNLVPTPVVASSSSVRAEVAPSSSSGARVASESSSIPVDGTGTDAEPAVESEYRLPALVATAVLVTILVWLGIAWSVRRCSSSNQGFSRVSDYGV